MAGCRALLAVTVVILLQLAPAASSAAAVSAKHSLVWGSGVRAEADTPARYVFIQAADAAGTNLTTSPGLNAFKVAVTLKDAEGRQRQVGSRIMDRGDGSFAVQYFFNLAATQLTVSVQTGSGQHVAASPYVLPGPLVYEGCDCPREPAEFEADYECAAADPAGQIARDLAPFVQRGAITRADIDDAIATLNTNNTALVHYTIVNNEVYSHVYGPYPAFAKFFDEMLFTLKRRVRLPDIEFLLNMGDWPQVPRAAADGTPQPPRPVFSWCSVEDHYDMLLPTYKMVQATVFGKDLENIQEVDGKSFTEGAAWEAKKELLLFRGRPSNAARTEGMLLAKKHRDLLDIRVTKNQYNYFPNDAARKEHAEYEKEFGPKADLQQLTSFFRYKYLLNIDGTVAAYRFGALLAGNSVTFKQKSNYYEHFYKALEPFVHYIPVEADLADVIEKVQWAKAHDSEAKAIMQRARAFTRAHLRTEDVYCYHLLAFQAFAELQNFQPQVAANQAPLADDAKTCTCPRRRMAKGTGRRSTLVGRGGVFLASNAPPTVATPAAPGSGGEDLFGVSLPLVGAALAGVILLIVGVGIVRRGTKQGEGKADKPKPSESKKKK